MAFQLDTTAADGRTVQGCYFVPVQINIGAADKTGRLVFYGYSSQDARNKGFAPVAGAVKEYAFTEEEFLAAQTTKMSDLFPDGIVGTNVMYEVLGRFAYGVALARKDVQDSPQLDEEGQQKKDDNGNLLWNMRSFFEEAQHV